MLRDEIDFIELELELIARLLKIITHTLIKYADLHKMLHKKNSPTFLNGDFGYASREVRTHRMLPNSAWP